VVTGQPVIYTHVYTGFRREPLVNQLCSLVKHGENDFVVSTKRFVNTASAEQNCCDAFPLVTTVTLINVITIHIVVTIVICHHNNLRLLRLLKQRFVEATEPFSP